MKVASALYPEKFYPNTQEVIHPDELNEDDYNLLILWGGEDISPSLYGERVVAAHAENRPSWRDEVEKQLAERAIQLGIPILGVCRGMQLLSTLVGGKLYQDVDNHMGAHPLIYKGETLTTNSCHHQMVIPNDEIEVLGYTPCRSKFKVRESGVVKDEGDEPEIIYIPRIKALGVQGHPEWLNESHSFVKLTKQLVKEKLHG